VCLLEQNSACRTKKQAEKSSFSPDFVGIKILFAAAFLCGKN